MIQEAIYCSRQVSFSPHPQPLLSKVWQIFISQWTSAWTPLVSNVRCISVGNMFFLLTAESSGTCVWAFKQPSFLILLDLSVILAYLVKYCTSLTWICLYLGNLMCKVQKLVIQKKLVFHYFLTLLSCNKQCQAKYTLNDCQTFGLRQCSSLHTYSHHLSPSATQI
jgi:hypothetical protein